MASLEFLSTNPFLEGWKDTDRWLTERDDRRVLAEQRRFSLDESRRKSAEAQLMDQVYRDAASIPDDTAIAPSRSQGAAAFDAARVAAPAQSGAIETRPVADLTVDQSFDPVRYQNKLIGFESGGNPTAKNPRSTATGLGQFIEGTWLAIAPTVAQRLGQDISGMSRADVLALRTDPDWSKAAIQIYADQNRGALEPALGRKVGEGDLRLAHGFGAGGARSLLTAPDDALVDSVVGPKVIAANPHLAGKTVAALRQQYGAGPGTAAVESRMATPEQQAAMAPVRNSPAGRALENYDWRSNTQGQDTMAGAESRLLADATGGRTMNDAGADLVGQITTRYTNPRAQELQRRAAQTPGMGKTAYEMSQGQHTERDRLGVKVLELVGQGKDQEAQALAQSIGMTLPPAMTGNPLMRRAVALVAKIPGLQYDSTAAVRFIRSYVQSGGDEARALQEMGDPMSRASVAQTRGPTGGAMYSFISKADGSIWRTNRQTGEAEPITPPGRPDQARARAAAAAAQAVKNGVITQDRLPVYMQVMERALLGDPAALQELETIVAPAAPPADPRSAWERNAPGFLGGQPAPAPAPPPRVGGVAPAAPTAAPQVGDPLGLR